jgi:hypothetical protein
MLATVRPASTMIVAAPAPNGSRTARSLMNTTRIAKGTHPMFYEYNQNNSGGGFDFDGGAGISHYVLIEANSPKQANALAEAIGLYFNGCEDGRDCDCCGDRWYPQSSYAEGKDKPSIYGHEVGADKPYKNTLWMKDQPEAFIHYLDGRVVPVEGAKVTWEEEKALFEAQESNV